jgi:hypothetical protein
MWALLNDFGIKAWNHYSPMHLATSFRSRLLGKVGDCPVAEAKFEQYVSLPIHPRLTDEAVAYMIDAIKQLSRRPHQPRLSPAPLLNALTSLYARPGTAHPHSSSDNEWQSFKAEVQAAAHDSFFSHAVPVTVARAPGRLDLMGRVPLHRVLFIESLHSISQAETTTTLVALCLSARYRREPLLPLKHAHPMA